ncbi:hypothetical protein Syun_015840 [Stephania yunnanensis]|uniref:Uncharacterized protein n=1 Tax=Stephania yunnanensis TaxID=152371 RepID=A0AAP0P1P1_9MAGN
MEGLIPYVYRAIVRYRAGGGQPPTPTSSPWFKDSPAAASSPFSYVRLPCSDSSGRFHPPSETINNAQTFTTTNSSSAATAPITQSLLCRLISSSIN